MAQGVIVVTGAAGALGRAVAERLAKDGYKVIALDLAEADAGSRLASELKERQLAPDVLINNAGYGLFGRTAELPYEQQIGIVDLNVRALTDLTLRLLPAMVARKNGGILNVASTAAFMPGPFMSLYYASKAYVLSFSEALAAELTHSGVTVTVLCPGPVPTGFQQRAQMKSMKFMRYISSLPADEVARAGWEGFKQRRRIVVPGTLNKAAAYAGRYAPRWLTLPVMRFLQMPPEARGNP
jgi:short-subunit dehydrogenase